MYVLAMEMSSGTDPRPRPYIVPEACSPVRHVDRRRRRPRPFPYASFLYPIRTLTKHVLLSEAEVSDTSRPGLASSNVGPLRLSDNHNNVSFRLLVSRCDNQTLQLERRLSRFDKASTSGFST